MKVIVTYKETLNKELDSKIRKAMEIIGGQWTGQGLDFRTNERDLSFEFEN